MSPGFTSLEKSRNSRMRFTAAPFCFLDMAEQRLGQTLFLLVVEAELDGVVAVLARLEF